MLSLKIERVSKGWAKGQPNIADQLEQIWQQCSNLTGDVQALSHELHPSILDNLGLVTAVKSLCREISEEAGVTVEFVASNIPEPLGRDVSLSLFRVVQEAVHNAIQYSGQKHFEVHLEGSSSELSLEIRDQGAGFDPANKNGGGLVRAAQHGGKNSSSERNLQRRFPSQFRNPHSCACTTRFEIENHCLSCKLVLSVSAEPLRFGQSWVVGKRGRWRLVSMLSVSAFHQNLPFFLCTVDAKRRHSAHQAENCG